MLTAYTGTITYNYDRFCPCFDGSGGGFDGGGLNTYLDTVEVRMRMHIDTRIRMDMCMGMCMDMGMGMGIEMCMEVCM